MSLRHQFSLLTSLLVLILLAGSLLLSLNNSQNAFEQQLNARAYDAANALALSMSQLASADEVQLARVIDALYDRGFFAKIEFEAIDGTLLHRRSDSGAADDSAPQWLKDWFPVELLEAEADVTKGWQRLGSVRVLSHSDFAYRDLWTLLRTELQWHALVLLITILLLQWMLYVLLKPLREVEKQAEAICNRQWLIQRKIPNAPELKRMVLAMNQMVQKLRTIFSEQTALTEQLRAESFSDTLSGLLNRRGFDQRLAHVLERQEGHSGVLLLLQLQNLAYLNQQLGRQGTDDVIHNLGRQLGFWLQGYTTAFAGRRSGSDFAIYLPASGRAQAQALAQQLFDQLSNTVLLRRQGHLFHIGGVFLQDDYDNTSLALSCADAALRQAQRQANGEVKLYEQNGDMPEPSASEWRSIILQALQDEALQLQFQPVINSETNQVVQLEVFSRLLVNGENISAGRFWPMVEQHHLSAQFDAFVVRQVIRYLEQEPLKDQQRCCINISPASVMNEQFQKHLHQWLSASPQVAQHIALEVPESSIVNIEPALVNLMNDLKPLGVAFGVDQVGTGNMAFSYLQRLPIHYMRIDGSFNRGLANAQDNRFFVQAMVQIAHSLDLQVLAEGVEQEDDVTALRNIGVAALSGYYFSRPNEELKHALSWKAA